MSSFIDSHNFKDAIEQQHFGINGPAKVQMVESRIGNQEQTNRVRQWSVQASNIVNMGQPIVLGEVQSDWSPDVVQWVGWWTEASVTGAIGDATVVVLAEMTAAHELPVVDEIVGRSTSWGVSGDDWDHGLE